jgi:Transcriptional regulator containing an amidase domain and an AraC-type DNA-binding HTH domain
MNEAKNMIIESFQNASKNEELFSKIIELFPYPIQVFSLEGTSLMINKAMAREFQIWNPEMHVGQYNVFCDPINVRLGIADQVRQVLKGKTVYSKDISVPYEDIIKRYGGGDSDIKAMYQDITAFPLMGPDNKPNYFVAIFITKKVYRGKQEITEAREYMENHWKDQFNINDIAKKVNLSASYFSRLFKKHVGCTPHRYYINIKIKKIKEKLSDPNITISEAFSACGLDYHGHYARLFKENTGFTPKIIVKCLNK